MSNSAQPQPQGKETQLELRMKFLGARFSPRVKGLDPLPGKSNYFLGNDPRKWRTNVPNFSRVRYESLYPGVDLMFYGNPQQLEYDFIVAPGGDPAQIQLGFDNSAAAHRQTAGRAARAAPLQIDSSGDLILPGTQGEVRLRKPLVYQEVQGARRELAGNYVLHRNGTVGFAVGKYNPELPLVIDPALEYSTYLGGTAADSAASIAVDNLGNVYVTGSTASADFPTQNPEQAKSGGGSTDAFVVKIDTTRTGVTSLVYSTYLGGSDKDSGNGIAVDSLGSAYVTGFTKSTDFPTTSSAFQTSCKRDVPSGLCLGDAFFTKLDATGSVLAYSTRLGGSASDSGNGIALDSNRNAYVTGTATSSDFPTSSGAFLSTCAVITSGNCKTAFVAKFDPAQSGALSLVYSTFLGGSGGEHGAGIAVDSAGNAYVTGDTASTDFPKTGGAFQSSLKGSMDAFLAKLKPDGTAPLIYATYLGGTGMDSGAAVAADNLGRAFLTGSTSSIDFPTMNPLQGASGGGADVFISKIDTTKSEMTSLVYSTYLGGTGDDGGVGIAIDGTGEAFVTGSTASPNFPVKHPLQGTLAGSKDAFLAELDATGSLSFSTFLSGSEGSSGSGVAVNTPGDVFIAGATGSHNFPTTAGAFQPACAVSPASGLCSGDAFVARLNLAAPAPALTSSSAVVNFNRVPVGTTANPEAVVLTNSGEAPVSFTDISIVPGASSAQFAEDSSNCIANSPLAAGASCTIMNITFTPTAAADEMATLRISDDAPVPGNTQEILLKGTGTEPIASPAPTLLDFGSQPQGTTSNSQTVVVSNVGNDTLNIAVNFSLGDIADFGFASGTTCGNPPTVLAGASCDINVVFVPMGTGMFQAQIALTDNSGNIPGSLQIVTVKGVGTPPAPLANLAPLTIDFSTQPVGTTSGPMTAVLTNSGSVTLNIEGLEVMGSGDFEFAPAARAVNGTVDPRNSCNINLKFHPTGLPGMRSAKLVVTDNANNVIGSTQTTSLTGIGTGPVADPLPNPLDFGSQLLGISSAVKAVVLGNTGNAPLHLAANNMVTISGTNAADFVPAAPGDPNACVPGGIVLQNKSCNVDLVFTPMGKGMRAAQVKIADDSGNITGNTQAIDLSGVGIAGTASLAPNSFDFPVTQLVGTTSASRTIVMTNVGTGPLTIAKIEIGSDFAIAGGATCANGTVLPPNVNNTCSTPIVFSPTTAGPRAGTLTFTDNSDGVAMSQQMVALTGTGMDFSFGPAPGGSTSASVSNGQPATYNLQVNAVNGFSGTVQLVCDSSAVPGYGCSAPSSVAVPGQISVTIAPMAHAWDGRWRGTPLFVPPAWQHSMIPAQMLVGLLAFLLIVRRVRRRWLIVVAPTTALALLLVLASCGGGGGTSGTPVQTFPVKVTGSVQGTSRTINLSLTFH